MKLPGRCFLCIMLLCGALAASLPAAPACAAEQEKSLQESAGAWDWSVFWTAVGALAAVAAVIVVFKPKKIKIEAIEELTATQNFKSRSDQEESARQYEGYRQSLIAEHDQESLPSSTLIQSITLPLSGIFVSLRLSDSPQTEVINDHTGKFREADGERYRTPQEVLRRAFEDERRMLLVIGAPGSGKTTLLRHYLLSLLKEGKYDDFGFQPATALHEG
jgi:type VI protein secretion system component VasK